MKPSENLRCLLRLRFALAGPRGRSRSGRGRVAASKGLRSPGRTSEGTGGSRGREGAGAERGAEGDPAWPSPALSPLLSSPPAPPVAAAARLSQRNVGGTPSSPGALKTRSDRHARSLSSRRSVPATPHPRRSGSLGACAGRAGWWCAASPAGGAGGSCPCCWAWPSSWASSPWRAGAGWSRSRSPTCIKRRCGTAARGARGTPTGAANPSWTTVSGEPPALPSVGLWPLPPAAPRGSGWKAAGANAMNGLLTSVVEQLPSGMGFPLQNQY